jgi:hypothetical protein
MVLRYFLITEWATRELLRFIFLLHWLSGNSLDLLFELWWDLLHMLRSDQDYGPLEGGL